jgi:nitrate reductase NapAB chaperone NapD
MAIAGVIIKVQPNAAEGIAAQISQLQGVEIEKTVAGNIVAVLEGPDVKWLNHVSTQDIQSIEGVIAVLPVYINSETPEELDAEGLVS